ncbi:MAG: SRPBCC family protein [Actinobacteria bacterium]|nr:SRPBCC family protein [Actinomycetota bacterium]
MAHIERSIEIEASPEGVFKVLTDLDRLPDWSTVTVTTHEVPDGELKVGTEFRQTLRVLGRNIDCDWRVTELDAPNRIAYEATAPGGGQLRMAQQVRGEGGRSRVELDLDYELPGGLAGELVDRAYAERRNEREAEHSLQNLKDLLEARP